MHISCPTTSRPPWLLIPTRCDLGNQVGLRVPIPEACPGTFQLHLYPELDPSSAEKEVFVETQAERCQLLVQPKQAVGSRPQVFWESTWTSASGPEAAQPQARVSCMRPTQIALCQYRRVLAENSTRGDCWGYCTP